MGKMSSIKQDLNLESDGVWMMFEEGIEVKIASINNVRFKDRLKRITKPHLEQLRRGIAPDGLEDKLWKQAGAHEIVRDWRNIQDDEGNEVVYSPEQCLEYFSQDAYREFFNFVVRSANASTVFRVRQESQAEGN